MLEVERAMGEDGEWPVEPTWTGRPAAPFAAAWRGLE
jgi:hypothetical protein